MKSRFRNLLAEHGFGPGREGESDFARVLGPMTQGIGFQKGGRLNSGKFTANLSFRINHRHPAEAPERTVWLSTRIGSLMPDCVTGDHWFGGKGVEIDKVVEEMWAAIVEHVIPLFGEMETVEALLAANEREDRRVRSLFAGSPHEVRFNRGRLLYLLGHQEQARPLLRAFLRDPVFAKGTNQEWVKEELRDAESLLLGIREPVEEVIRAGGEEERMLLLEYSLEEVREHLDDEKLRERVCEAIEHHPEWVPWAARWIREGLEADEKMRELANSSVALKKWSQRERAMLLKVLKPRRA